MQVNVEASHLRWPDSNMLIYVTKVFFPSPKPHTAHLALQNESSCLHRSRDIEGARTPKANSIAAH